MKCLQDYAALLMTLEKRLCVGVASEIPDDTVSDPDGSGERNEYRFSIEIPTEMVESVLASEWHSLFAAFEETINVKLQQGFDPAEEFRDEMKVAEFIKSATNQKSATIGVDVTLDKTAFLNRVVGEKPAAHLRYYVTERAANEAFSAPLDEIEAWFPDDKRVVIIAPLGDCHLRGTYLSVLSDTTPLVTVQDEAALPPTLRPEASTDPTRTAHDELQRRWEKRAKEVRYLHGTTELLPDHLYITTVSLGATTVPDTFPAPLQALIVSTFYLILRSLATTTDRKRDPITKDYVNPKQWIGTFEGIRKVEVEIPDKPPVPTPVLSRAAYDQWYHLYEGIYRIERTGEMLTVLRQLFSMQLQGTASQNYQKLLTSNDDLLKRVEELYRRFMGESVEKYFTKLKEMSAYFQSRMDAINKQISDLLEALVKNLLAVFGVATGTLLIKASEAQDKSLPILPWFVLGATVLIAFVTTVYYTANWRAFKLTSDDFQTNRDSASNYFDPKDIEKTIEVPFNKRKDLFVGVYVSTLIIYVLLIGVGLASFSVLFQNGKKGSTKPPNAASNASSVSAGNDSRTPVVPDPVRQTPKKQVSASPTAPAAKQGVVSPTTPPTKQVVVPPAAPVSSKSPAGSTVPTVPPH